MTVIVRDDGLVEIECTFETESEQAVCILEEDAGKLWFPFSHVVEMHRDKNEKGSIVVTRWIAKQKGLV